jgi:lipopolysaccharide transport system ATP-binding protein
MRDVAGEGRTILLVSHNMGAIQGLCERSIWLEQGQLVEMGPTSEIVPQYLRRLSQSQMVFGPTSPITIEGVCLRNSQGEQTNSIKMTEAIDIEIAYHAKARYEKPVLIVVVHSVRTGAVFAANSLLDGRMPDYLEGHGMMRLRFLNPALLPQSYFITLDIRNKDNRDTLFPNQEIFSFDIVGKMADYGFSNERADYFAQDSYPLITPYEWVYDDKTVERVELAHTRKRAEP